jgi:hypothetical protein
MNYNTFHCFHELRGNLQYRPTADFNSPSATPCLYREGPFLTLKALKVLTWQEVIMPKVRKKQTI